ncbi:arf-GAP domain and FG repeat-containing protein 1a isoform X3 [Danio rerio]|uniref:Arf-GAP domain and FG repeat-containing protein 1a isoform X3 n=1 Tax=Danio rerio TaxID=7955 RepID=A0A8M9QH37_DANRE|nr:arf-GAP domain and FG repeat-containing protein 1 isoform X2 [Danio rerio]|eukprot:XP_021337019.1 arf-GAP domain and FG repeat-containing protein 1 isoform X2 [Danio rerio]
MAASAKRKQEEKHLKMLREMTSLAPNRKCFDCDQRGPTYANMTVGSFVCTSCSGILRGLNPPHRVKSISMTTFTQQEIELLQKHGNEVCKQIWLGLYDDRNLAIPDFREPQKVKEFLQDKYEKKRWYVPPEQAKTVASVHASISGSSASSTSSTPEVRPLKTLLGESVPSLHLNKNTPSQSPVVSRAQLAHQQYQDRKFDLLSDLGGDIFAPPHSQSTGNANFANFAHFNSHSAQSVNASADFANFDTFKSSAAPTTAAFPSAPQAPFQPPQPVYNSLPFSRSVGEFTSLLPPLAMHSSSSGLSNANFANFDNFHKSCSADFPSFSSSQSNSVGDVHKADAVSVPADRYAALADLDNIFSSKPEQGPSSAPPSAGVGPPPPQAALLGGDRYAAFAELDNVFGPSVPNVSGYQAATTAQGAVYGTSSAVPTAQAQQGLPNIPQGFAGPSTNPFVAPGAPQAPPTNPFQANGRAAVPGMGVAAAASFGPPSMSMPTGFGNTAAYNLPTSYSGNFQQAFPGQPFNQPHAYPQQPNGGFAAFGQGKVTPFGQNMVGQAVTNNPFLAGAPAAQFPAGGSTTNPFL